MLEYLNIEEILEKEGQYIAVGCGNSMWPMLRSKNDPVLIQPLKTVRNGLPRRRDVVVYRKDDRLVVHRVLKVLPDKCIIRGDNCIALEEVPHEDIFGIVTMFWRNGRKYDIDSKAYNIYVTLWLLFHPIYRILKRIVGKVRRIIWKNRNKEGLEANSRNYT